MKENGIATRRALMGMVAVASISGGYALAQEVSDWPVRQSRFVIPFAPGGGQDVFWRIIAERLSHRMRATFIVENKGGAGGALGAQDVVRAAPDGGTFLATTNGVSILPSLYPQLGFNPEQDLTPVSLLCDAPSGLVVRTDSPIKDLSDLIRQAKAQPGKLTFGSGGVGSSNHLSATLMALAAGINVTHVPYRGVAQAMTAIYAGEIDYAFSSMLELLSHVRQGRLRLIGVTSATRMPELPDVPAIAETVPGYAAPNWFAMFAPKGFSGAALDRLVKELAMLRQDPDLNARLQASGASIRLDGPGPLAARLAEDVPKWRAVVAQANIRAE